MYPQNSILLQLFLKIFKRDSTHIDTQAYLHKLIIAHTLAKSYRHKYILKLMHKHIYKHKKHHTCIYIDMQMGTLPTNVKHICIHIHTYIQMYSHTNVYMQIYTKGYMQNIVLADTCTYKRVPM